jgi:hypothetical protein
MCSTASSWYPLWPAARLWGCSSAQRCGKHSQAKLFRSAAGKDAPLSVEGNLENDGRNAAAEERFRDVFPPQAKPLVARRREMYGPGHALLDSRRQAFLEAVATESCMGNKH